MQFQREELTEDFFNEVYPLLVAHKDEIAHFKDIDLGVDKDTYFNVQEAGAFRLFTIRDEDLLVGYCGFFIKHNPHYKTSLQANQDVLFLAKEYRKAMLGLKFIAYCDEELKNEGIQVVRQHIKAAHNFGKALERMGYELEDLIYVKRLDKEGA